MTNEKNPPDGDSSLYDREFREQLSKAFAEQTPPPSGGTAVPGQEEEPEPFDLGQGMAQMKMMRDQLEAKLQTRFGLVQEIAATASIQGFLGLLEWIGEDATGGRYKVLEDMLMYASVGVALLGPAEKEVAGE